MSTETLESYAARQAATVGRRARQVPQQVWVPRLPKADGHYLGVWTPPGGQSSLLPELTIFPDSRAMLIVSSSKQVGCVDLTNSNLLWTSTIDLGPPTPHLIKFIRGSSKLIISSRTATHLLDPVGGIALEHLLRGGFGNPSPSFHPPAPSGELIRFNQIFDQVRALDRFLVQGLAMSPDDKYLATGDVGGHIDIFDATTGSHVVAFQPHPRGVWGLRYSPDGQQILATYHDGVVLILDSTTGAVKLHCDERVSVSALDWSPDGNLFAVAGRSSDGHVRDAQTGEIVFTFAYGGCLYLSWAPNGGYIATSERGDSQDLYKFWDVQHLLPGLPAPAEDGNVARPAESLRQLVSGLVQLHQLDIPPPLSLLRDLMELTAGRPVDDPIDQLLTDPTSRLREMAALRWPAPARLGLVALLLHNQPATQWQPPPNSPPVRVREALTAALSGEAVEPETPPAPMALLREADKQVSEQLLTLLSLLGPEAVAADPGLPLRLLPRLPELPTLKSTQRRLLGLRVRISERRGKSVGSNPDADRARVGGVESGRRTDWGALLPSQLALPRTVLTYRHMRGELLFRAREVAEPPRLHPTVIMLDVSPPTFGPVESVTRLAAFIAGRTLQQADIGAVLVLTGGGHGGGELVRELRQPIDLLEVWLQRSLRVAQARRSLRLAGAVRDSMRSDGAQDPLVLLLTQAWFGAEEEVTPIGGMRGLFVQYPGQQVRPVLAGLCERWESVGNQIEGRDLAEKLGYLLG